jgi:hypothetical protein
LCPPRDDDYKVRDAIAHLAALNYSQTWNVNHALRSWRSMDSLLATSRAETRSRVAETGNRQKPPTRLDTRGWNHTVCKAGLRKRRCGAHITLTPVALLWNCTLAGTSANIGGSIR